MYICDKCGKEFTRDHIHKVGGSAWMCEECKAAHLGHKTLRWSYSEAKRHVDAIESMRRERRRRLCKAAGIDLQYMPHARNAKISADHGNPWPNVNYSLVRQILWLDRRSSEAYHILQRYVTKRDRDNPFWIQPNQGKFA